MSDALTDDMENPAGLPETAGNGSQDALIQAEEIIRNASEADDSGPEALIPETALPSMKTPKKARSTRKTSSTSSASAVDTLTETVASLARTVESLSEKIDVPGDPSNRSTTRSSSSRKRYAGPTTADNIDQPNAGKQPGLRDVTLSLTRVLAYTIGVGLVATAAGMEHAGSSMLAFAAVGIVTFVVASTSEPGDQQSAGLSSHARRVGSAVLVVVGLGLVVGGLQHFGEVPQRAAKMIPAGVALFTAGFFVRGRHRLASEQLAWVAGAGIWVCLLLTLGLGAIAGSMQDEPAIHDTPAATAGSHSDAAATDSHDTPTTSAVNDDHGANASSSDTHATSSNNKSSHHETGTGH